MSPGRCIGFRLISKVDEATEDPMGASPPSLHLDALILAVLTKDPFDPREFDRQARRYGGTVLRAIAPDLPEDRHDEVVNEAVVCLLTSGLEGWRASGRDATPFFYACLRQGLRQVRANYAPPGVKTRRPTQAERKAAKPIVASKRPILPPEAHPDPSAAAAFAEVEHQRDAAEILARAPEMVGRALRLLCFDDLEHKDVAAELGLSRQALYRRLDKFAQPYREAA
jgi:DNA-directed RNA polymerase specialized sigma24 family protein